MGRIAFINANIIDGSNTPSQPGNVLVNNGVIERITQDDVSDFGDIIDCRGKYLAPGFIDAHSHMDFYAATENPDYFNSFTRQGITTYIGGNCGFSPCASHSREHRHLLENTLFEVPKDADVVCDDFSVFSKKANGAAFTHNFYAMVGHGSYRTALSGHDKRDLSEREYQKMFSDMECALEKGAVGVSLGLQYKPGVFVKRAEILDVARLAKKHDKVLAVHAKAYSCLSGTYPPNPFSGPHNLLAIRELLEVAEETGVKLQFSHLIFVGRKTWKTVDKALAMFDQAIARGVDVAFDMFPYPFGATLLNTMLPEWFMASMPKAANSPLARARLWVELRVGLHATGFSYPDMQLTYPGSDRYSAYEGCSIEEIAAATGQSGFNTLLDLLVQSNGQTRMLFHTYYGPGLVERLMAHKACLYATDAWPELSGRQNPAAFGSYPRFLQIARDTGCVSLEEAVYKMTGFPASRFGLDRVGLLRPGGSADLVLFDPDRVGDNTSSEDQSASPSGIEQVYSAGMRVQ